MNIKDLEILPARSFTRAPAVEEGLSAAKVGSVETGALRMKMSYEK